MSRNSKPPTADAAARDVAVMAKALVDSGEDLTDVVHRVALHYEQTIDALRSVSHDGAREHLKLCVERMRVANQESRAKELRSDVNSLLKVAVSCSVPPPGGVSYAIPPPVMTFTSHATAPATPSVLPTPSMQNLHSPMINNALSPTTPNVKTPVMGPNTPAGGGHSPLSSHSPPSLVPDLLSFESSQISLGHSILSQPGETAKPTKAAAAKKGARVQPAVPVVSPQEHRALLIELDRVRQQLRAAQTAAASAQRTRRGLEGDLAVQNRLLMGLHDDISAHRMETERQVERYDAAAAQHRAEKASLEERIERLKEKVAGSDLAMSTMKAVQKKKFKEYQAEMEGAQEQMRLDAVKFRDLLIKTREAAEAQKKIILEQQVEPLNAALNDALARASDAEEQLVQIRQARRLSVGPGGGLPKGGLTRSRSSILLPVHARTPGTPSEVRDGTPGGQDSLATRHVLPPRKMQPARLPSLTNSNRSTPSEKMHRHTLQ